MGMFGGKEIKGKVLAVIGLGHIGAATATDAKALEMDVVGYDPGLSVESALRLPNEIKLVDSLASAVVNADFVSLNIPYIKGEGGSHGIIGQEIIDLLKPDAVILNFARGELVDSETVKEYLESGTIRNSVNFPEVSLPAQGPGIMRFTVVNENKPGMLAKITEIFASAKFNITQQVNHSRGDIAYNVLDVSSEGHNEVVTFKTIQEQITMLDGVMSSRLMYGTPGTGYAKNLKGKYFV